MMETMVIEDKGVLMEIEEVEGMKMPVAEEVELKEMVKTLMKKKVVTVVEEYK